MSFARSLSNYKHLNLLCILKMSSGSAKRREVVKLACSLIEVKDWGSFKIVCETLLTFSNLSYRLMSRSGGLANSSTSCAYRSYIFIWWIIFILLIKPGASNIGLTSGGLFFGIKVFSTHLVSGCVILNHKRLRLYSFMIKTSSMLSLINHVYFIWETAYFEWRLLRQLFLFNLKEMALISIFFMISHFKYI